MSIRQQAYAMAERTPYLPVDAALRICNVLFSFVAVMFNLFMLEQCVCGERRK
jgi:hypothetical protein